ncbi:HAD family phosphatase [Oculatella sp. LEGE 06141]|uniref:HAD family hydrolase n=1 Tax=Oculatella sp. LEGE 06141 TaxID=1828648 RepID=UPI00187E182E|nr:HAD family phosphatase [Oculatella sp. LEGE 06141]MBE9181487.1 HAD family phosphatase [Oculatella sp. LEGE 06141]
MLQALLFDLDGTLANTDPIHYQTWKDVLKPYGIEIDRPFYDSRFSGRLNIDIVKNLLPQLSLEEGSALSRFKEAEFRNRATNALKPMPGLFDVMQWADEQGLKKAIVTNAPAENAVFLLQVLGLEHRFETVVLGDELPKGKPDPMPYQVALAELHVPAEEAIAFEDSPSGIRSAVSAGILTVGIASTQALQDLHDLGASLVVADFTAPQLADLLRRDTTQNTPDSTSHGASSFC